MKTQLQVFVELWWMRASYRPWEASQGRAGLAPRANLVLLDPAVHRMGALAGIFLPSLSESDVSPTLGRDEGRVHIHRHHLIQDQSAAAVFWPNLTLLQPRSTDDAVMGTLPHAAGEEFYPNFHRPESFRAILRRTIFLSSVKVATGSRERWTH